MATLGIQVNPAAVSRIKSLLMDPAYKESIEQSSSYNTRLCQERKMRLPFLDAQTGVAQSNCYLWMTKRQRMPGQTAGQLYTYPSKRWRKKRRQYLINFLRPTRTRDIELNESDVHQICTVENSSTKDSDDRDEKATEDSKDSWYKDYEDASEPPDAGEIDEPESDFDDYEETYTKRRKKKTVTKTKKKEKAEPLTDAEKPYVCEACGARYKTRPGLTYHYTHSHNGLTESTDDENTVPSPPKPPASTIDPLAEVNTSVQSAVDLVNSARSGKRGRRVGRRKQPQAHTATSVLEMPTRTRRQSNLRNLYLAQIADDQGTHHAYSSLPT